MDEPQEEVPAKPTKAKLYLMPNMPLSPTLLLHQMLENVDQMEGIAVCIVHKDGSLRSGWTQLDTGQLAAASMCLSGTAMEQLRS